MDYYEQKKGQHSANNQSLPDESFIFLMPSMSVRKENRLSKRKIYLLIKGECTKKSLSLDAIFTENAEGLFSCMVKQPPVF